MSSSNACTTRDLIVFPKSRAANRCTSSTSAQDRAQRLVLVGLHEQERRASAVESTGSLWGKVAVLRPDRELFGAQYIFNTYPDENPGAVGGVGNRYGPASSGRSASTAATT